MLVSWIATGGAIIIGSGYYYLNSNRLRLTQLILGITGVPPTKTHAVAKIKYRTIDEYLKSLDRSTKSTMKRVVKLQTEIEVHTIQTLGTHWSVCVDHERRIQSYGLIVGTLRWLVAYFMYGTIHEFRDKSSGELLCWTLLIHKGDTLRVMWFYQKTRACKRYLWFYVVRRAIDYCIQRNISSLDLGPSNGNQQMETIKTKCGFASILDWDKEYGGICNYSGPFVEIA